MKKILLTFPFLFFTILFCIPVSAECNHQWGEWIIDWEGNCGDDGYKHRYCDLCEAYDEQTILATGNHVWDEWWIDTDPSCYEKGSKIRYCKVCNDVEYADIPAYGSHDWTPWKTTDQATCAYRGSEERECKRCWHTQSRTTPVSQTHTFIYSSWDNTYIRATALKSGKAWRCCDCGDVEEYKFLPKLKAKIVLNKKSVSIKKNKNYTLKIKSQTYGDKILKWKSSKKKIATVNSKGKITAKKKGTAIITLYMKSGVKATCKVKVK